MLCVLLQLGTTAILYQLTLRMGLTDSSDIIKVQQLGLMNFQS
jgi:hypothetical protein